MSDRSDVLPDFPTSRFDGYPGLWVGAERYADLKAEVERVREAIAAARQHFHALDQNAQEAIDWIEQRIATSREEH